MQRNNCRAISEQWYKYKSISYIKGGIGIIKGNIIKQIKKWETKKIVKMAVVAVAFSVTLSTALTVHAAHIIEELKGLDTRESASGIKVGEGGLRGDFINITREEEEDIEVKVNKQTIDSVKQARQMDIRTKSNWEREDFEGIVNDDIKELIDVAVVMEKEVGVNAIYLMAVGINETGWGKHMAGENNYFNWTNDGVNHFSFESIKEFTEYSLRRYEKDYVREGFYKERTGKDTAEITIEVVNTVYAKHLNGEINWVWADTVSKIMKMLSDRKVSKGSL